MRRGTDLLEACFCTRIRRLSRLMTRYYNGQLRASGLGIAQLSILSAIQRSGRTSLGQLSIQLAVERTTLLRNTELLRRRGWVQTTKKKGERSSVSLTTNGLKALSRAIPIWNRVQSRVRKMLGPQCARAITHVLPSMLGKF